jgi:hypothetical protein
LLNIKNKTLFASQSYAPAFFEWALWRLLLAVNDIQNPIHETRGFRVDDSFVPLHHAAPGAADCTFIYEKHVLVIEVTLTVSGRQVATEGEPVRRHVAEIMHKHPQKDVLCLFVAPQININTYDEFFDRFYRVEAFNYYPKLAPLTISDIILLISTMLKQEYFLSSIEFIALLNELIVLRGEHRDGADWRNSVVSHFNSRVQAPFTKPHLVL